LLVTFADGAEHPTESDNLLFEDMWACQQMQKAMKSPAYQVGAMARISFNDCLISTRCIGC
jgi:hypothetical protein